MIETKRLILREFTLNDAGCYFRLNSDRGVVRYTGDRPFRSLEDARQTLREAPLRDYEIHGYGRLACIEKSSSKLIGFSGVKYLREMDEVDIGYRFSSEYWGKGYATESANAVMEYAHNVLGLQRIIGIVDPDNIASVKVLLKLGMSHERKLRYGSKRAEFDLYATRTT